MGYGLQALGEQIAKRIPGVVEAAVQHTPEKAKPIVMDTLDVGAKAIGDVGDLWDRSLTPGREFMKKMGLKDLSSQMDEVDTRARLRAGQSYGDVLRILEPFRKGNKFNPKDMAHIVDLIENPAEKPQSNLHRLAADRIQDIFDDYGVDAEELKIPVIAGAKFARSVAHFEKQGLPPERARAAAMRVKGVVSPFARRENYFPHYFSEATINGYLMPGSKREAALQSILSRGLATSRDEAHAVLQRMLRQPGEFRGGVLQHARETLDISDYDRDISEVMKRYLFTSARTLEQARKFGTSDELAMKHIDEFFPADKQGWRRSARNLYAAWAGTRDPDYSNLARATGTIHAITMLSTAGIIQPAQMINTAAMIGWGNALKGMATVAKDWRKAKLMAADMGAIFDVAHRDFAPDSFKSLSEMWSKVIGLDGLDRMNRVASSIGGRFWGAHEAEKMARGKVDITARRLFEEAGVPVRTVLEQGGKLTEEQTRRLGLFISNKTQFGSGVLDLPEFRNTPAGRFAYLFKSFSLQQSNFINQQLLKPFGVDNDMRPILRWSLLGIPTGAVLAEVVRRIKNRETPEDEKVRLVENLAIVGGYGMFFDAFRAMANGPQSIANWVMGPTATEAFQFVGADMPPIWKNALEGEEPNFEPLVHHMVSRVPMAGQWMKQAMVDE